MNNWMTPTEAMRFFGMDTVEELEQTIIEFDIEADFNTAGDVIAIECSDLKEALFTRHERQVGYRPDDEVEVARQRSLSVRRDRDHKKRRDDRRKLLVKRVIEKAGKVAELPPDSPVDPTGG